MSLVHSFTVGRFRCHTLEGGLQRLDGGAMFGVVPKPLWERMIPPDERNRIPLAMRCLLVEHPDGLVLIDSGLGNKENAKFHQIYGIENAGRLGPTQLEDALEAAGFAPSDVRWVINTHLHFDHAGGNTMIDPDRPDAPAVPAFPNATYVVQGRELEFARHTNERTRASYFPHNFEPVAATGRWRLLDGDGPILPGIRARLTPGHVPWHQAILVESDGETAAFIADLIPTTSHLGLPWIMGYDVEPLRTLESKRALLRDAADGGWLLVFEHDAATRLGRAAWGGSNAVLTDPVSVAVPDPAAN